MITFWISVFLFLAGVLVGAFLRLRAFKPSQQQQEAKADLERAKEEWERRILNREPRAVPPVIGRFNDASWKRFEDEETHA